METGGNMRIPEANVTGISEASGEKKVSFTEMDQKIRSISNRQLVQEPHPEAKKLEKTRSFYKIGKSDRASEISEAISNQQKGFGIVSKSMAMIRSNAEKVLKKMKSIREWAQGKELPTEKQVVHAFTKISEDKGHNSDGQDVFRHVMAGVVTLKEEASSSPDLFRSNDVHLDNLAGAERAEEEKKKQFLDRMDVLLDTLGGKAGMDEDALISFKDTLVNTKLDSMGDAILNQMNEWRKGSPEEKNLARLMHTLNQNFHMGPLSQQTLTALKNFEGAPYQLAGLEGSEFKLQGKKQIDISFGKDNDVRVTHRTVIEQVKEGGGNVSVTQTVVLSSKLDNLSKWNYKLGCEIKAGRQDKDLEVAGKIYGIYEALGINLNS